jgi:hypothetical protein
MKKRCLPRHFQLFLHEPPPRHLCVIQSISLHIVVKMHSRWHDESLQVLLTGEQCLAWDISRLCGKQSISPSNCNNYVRFIDFWTRKSVVWTVEYVLSGYDTLQQHYIDNAKGGKITITGISLYVTVVFISLSQTLFRKSKPQLEYYTVTSHKFWSIHYRPGQSLHPRFMLYGMSCSSHTIFNHVNIFPSYIQQSVRQDGRQLQVLTAILSVGYGAWMMGYLWMCELERIGCGANGHSVF